MKFIVDAQLPKTLSDFLKHKGYNSIHTSELPTKNATSDKALTSLALEEDRIIITKDHDFLESYLLYKKPRKLIVVKTGNITNPVLLNLFDKNLEMVITMMTRSNYIIITSDNIIEQE